MLKCNTLELLSTVARVANLPSLDHETNFPEEALGALRLDFKRVCTEEDYAILSAIIDKTLKLIENRKKAIASC